MAMRALYRCITSLCALSTLKRVFFPGNCSLYHFVVEEGIIYFLGTEQ